jgi:hypothetical protein
MMLTTLQRQTLRSLYVLLKEKGVRLVVAQVLDDVKQESHHNLVKLFGEDALFDTLEDVVNEFERQQNTSYGG